MTASTRPTVIAPPAPLELVSFHPAPPRPPSDDVATVVPPAPCRCEACNVWDEPTYCDRRQEHPEPWWSQLPELAQAWLSAQDGAVLDPCDLVHELGLRGVTASDETEIARVLCDVLRRDEEPCPRVVYDGAVRCPRCLTEVAEDGACCDGCGRELVVDLVPLVRSVVAAGGVLNDERRVA